MRPIAALALVALVAGHAVNAAAAPDLIRTLPNKVTVIVREAHARPIVSIQAWIKAGSRDEAVKDRGIAALAAQCVGEATERHPQGDLQKEVSALGGTLQREAGYDFSYVDLSLPSRAMSRGIEMLADALMHSKLDASILSSARGRVESQSTAVLEAVERAATSALRTEVHSGTPMAVPLVTRAEEFRAITMTLVERFYRERYVAENLTVVITGDVDAENAVQKIAGAFQDMPRASASSRSKFSQRPISGPRVLPIRSHVDTYGTAVAIGFRGPAWGTADALALDVLLTLLADSPGSRMQKRLDSGNAGFLHAYAAGQFEVDGGTVTLALTASPDSVQEAEGELLTLVEQARSTPVSAEDFDTAARTVLQRELFTRMDPRGVGRATAISVLRGKPGADEVTLERYRALRPEDLIAVARKYLDVKQSVFVEMGPDSVIARWAPSELARRIKDKQAVYEAAYRTGPAVTASADGERAARVDAPLRSAASTPLKTGRGRVVRAALPGGTRLLTSEDHSTPVVTVAFYLMGGVRYENDLNNGITALVRESLLNTNDPANKELTYRQKFQLMGRLVSYQDKDMWGCEVTAPSDEWEDVLRRMGGMFSHPDLDTVNVDATRLYVLETLDGWLHDEGAQRQRLIFPTKYRVSGYRLPALGSHRTLVRIPHADIESWYQKFIVQPNLVVCVFGDVDPAKVRPAVEAAVRDIASGPLRPGTIAREGEFDGFREKWELGGGAIHTVTVAFNGPPARSPDIPALYVMNSLLSGPKGWFEQYIVKPGGVSATSVVSQALDETLIIAVVQANEPQQEKDMVQLLFRQFKKAALLPLEGVMAPDLENAKAHAMGSYLMSLDSNPTRAFQYGRSELFGLGVDYPILLPAKIDGVVARDLLRIGAAHFQRGEWTRAPYAVSETRPGGW